MSGSGSRRMGSAVPGSRGGLFGPAKTTRIPATPMDREDGEDGEKGRGSAPHKHFKTRWLSIFYPSYAQARAPPLGMQCARSVRNSRVTAMPMPRPIPAAAPLPAALQFLNPPFPHPPAQTRPACFLHENRSLPSRPAALFQLAPKTGSGRFACDARPPYLFSGFFRGFSSAPPADGTRHINDSGRLSDVRAPPLRFFGARLCERCAGLFPIGASGAPAEDPPCFKGVDSLGKLGRR